MTVRVTGLSAGAIPSRFRPGTAGGETLVLDARGFAAEGPESLALAIQRSVSSGFRQLIVHGAKGHRFIGNGLGPETEGSPD